MITERLFTKPYYSKIIFCSTSGKLDKTAEVLSKNVKTPNEYIKEENLLPYLKRHLKRKLKYYAMVKHVLSKMMETNEEMARIISKHFLMEIEDRIAYIACKLVQHQTASYPYNTLLVLDDAAGSPLLKNGNSELSKNYAMNNPKAVGTVLHAITPFATAFNPALGTITSTDANIFSHIPKGSITDKLVKISEQFAKGELKSGGSPTAQAAADSRKRSSKAIPFKGI
ncbi:hypothetical protein M9Y10_021324 [Tritrichomonas musculus]|uniref:Uncharacterized protein n=1 Tax=Tritrichomonas musculus TaxID=1915356 RepID=A0ABR2HES4_9EUKA